MHKQSKRNNPSFYCLMYLLYYGKKTNMAIGKRKGMGNMIHESLEIAILLDTDHTTPFLLPNGEGTT